MATSERLGRYTGLSDITLRTDAEILTRKKLEYNAKNLNDFDAVLFYTGGDLEMDAQQKADVPRRVQADGPSQDMEFARKLSSAGSLPKTGLATICACFSPKVHDGEPDSGLPESAFRPIDTTSCASRQ